MNMSLSSQAIRRLLAAKGSWVSIALATGVSYSWLCKFAHGRIPNPSVQRIERILWYFEEMDALSIQELVQSRQKLPITPPSPQSGPTGEETTDE
ncbi:helix-turn-helix domain-containing protein [Acidithiobacillus ferrooxidans]|uniref:helix-turn-helix domain-containing protein n=1 Tax=Acidithiobacillus ferrooxidans TaxID=920 RepID=UPI001C06C8CB|nr:helix-turn-helix domain-containing protein [Acidithiobacillus ferrooxidans]MBU2774794.1 helix-turn-helix domain-containing protein [Acidithiobacillus ferrooxidans]